MGWQIRQKRQFLWLHPTPTSLEAYSLLYLYLFSSVSHSFAMRLKKCLFAVIAFLHFAHSR
jgi:hypothetical protein